MKDAENRLKDMVLYAWVQTDDLKHNDEIGLAQALVPAGYIPLVAKEGHLDRLTSPGVLEQIEAASLRPRGTKKYLCRFRLTEIITETKGGE